MKKNDLLFESFNAKLEKIELKTFIGGSAITLGYDPTNAPDGTIKQDQWRDQEED